MRTTLLLLIAALLFAPACYHATVDTGRSPNGVMIEKRWANSFIYGLVPPDIVETASKCPSGLATVDTQLSFLNQLVGVLTLGIYTPMEIVVACAGSTASVGDSTVVDAGPDRESQADALQTAAEVSKQTHEPVYVQF